MKPQLTQALRDLFQSQIHKHRMNVEVMLANPTAIHEHSDIMSALEQEIALMAEYMDKLAVIEQYFDSGESS